MRDDIQAHYSRLVTLLTQKNDLLQTLLNSEIDLKHYSKADNVDKMLSLIENDDLIIDNIDILDFDIRQDIDQICTLCEISFSDFIPFTKEISEPLSQEMLQLYNDSINNVKKLIDQRNKLVPFIETAKQSIKSSIEELDRIQKLRKSKK